MIKRQVFLFVFVVSFSILNAQVPFHKGVNITSWFQSENISQVQFGKYSKQDFKNIKSLGCDVVRLPINLRYMTNGEPDYTPSPVFLEYMDTVINWVEDLQMHIILDNHTFSVEDNTLAEDEVYLTAVWPQVAEYFKDRSNLIFYEILNEPHGIADDTWGTMQEHVIDAIREKDKKHTIIVGPSSYNSYNNLDLMPVYSDTNLIYTFHFYDPFLFTHQGAAWAQETLPYVKDIPFPYDAANMPAKPSEIAGTWVSSSFDNYANDGTIAKVKELIDIAIAFRQKNDVNIYCGEFGVYKPNSPKEDRYIWYNLVTTYLNENNVPWTMWDYKGGFGLFDDGGNDLFEYDVDTALIRSMGLNVPEKKEYVAVPDSSGFMLYGDYFKTGMYEASYTNGGSIDYASQQSPNNDNYCIEWKDGSRYGTTVVDFKPNKDFFFLSTKDYWIDFFIRGNAESHADLDIRFLDSKVDATDHPWRMSYTLTKDHFTWDGKWYHIKVPLNDMFETGSWDEQWYNPNNEFDWSAIDRFEIVSEHSDMENKILWIDNILISNEDTATIHDTSTVWLLQKTDVIHHTDKQNQITIFPNPVNDKINLEFSVNKNETCDVLLLDISGKVVFTTQYIPNSSGNQHVEISLIDSGEILPGGIYVIKFISSEITVTRKLTVVSFK